MHKATNAQFAATVAPQNTIYLARQPIFDRSGDVAAYEILFRNSTTNSAFIEDGNQATSQLIINTFVEMGLDTITNGKLAFINLTRDFLTGLLPLPFPPGKVVLEILEDISADVESIAGSKHLAELGYTLALDDFILSEQNLDLVPYATYIKVDILPMDEAAIRDQVRQLKPFKVKLLAEKVETQAEYELCRELGFELFQGYFFSKPTVMSATHVPANNLTLLEILAKLQAPDCDLADLEKVISMDLGISYKLLKIINSSFYGLTKKVESIQHALVILGLKTIKNWVTVISLSMVKNKPGELITMTLMRARMCESLASKFNCKPDAAFLVGLFSLLDVLLDQPRETLLADLPLSEDIAAALLRGEGMLGHLLTFVTRYEKGVWDDKSARGLSEADAVYAYMQTMQWTRDITQQLG